MENEEVQAEIDGMISTVHGKESFFTGCFVDFKNIYDKPSPGHLYHQEKLRVAGGGEPGSPGSGSVSASPGRDLT